MPVRALPALKGYSTPELKSLLEEIKLTIRKQESSLLKETRKRRQAPAVAAKTKAPPAKHVTPAPAPAPAPVKVVEPTVEVKLPTLTVPKPPEAAPSPAPGVIKYMHPANRNMTWDGIGKQPEWLQAYMDRGGSWTALENTAEKFASIKKFSRCI